MPDKKPDDYKTESQLKEEAKARREQEEKLLEQRPKSAGQQKRENYWYHYKWHTIAGVLVLVAGIFFLKDIFFTTKSDAMIIMISDRYFSQESIDDLERSLEKEAKDFNGDGKVAISIDYITLPSQGETADPGQSQQNYAMSMKLVTVIAAGVDPIFLLDDAAYNYIASMSETAEDAEKAFFPVTAPADSLEFTNEGFRSGFEGLRFYVRSFNKDEAYLEYCKELVESLQN